MEPKELELKKYLEEHIKPYEVIDIYEIYFEDDMRLTSENNPQDPDTSISFEYDYQQAKELFDMIKNKMDEWVNETEISNVQYASVVLVKKTNEKYVVIVFDDGERLSISSVGGKYEETADCHVLKEYLKKYIDKVGDEYEERMI